VIFVEIVGIASVSDWSAGILARNERAVRTICQYHPRKRMGRRSKLIFGEDY
jgi:hypothetical protein